MPTSWPRERLLEREHLVHCKGSLHSCPSGRIWAGECAGGACLPGPGWLSCGLREGSFCWALRSGSGVGDGSRPQPLGRPAYGKLGAPLGTRHWTCVLLLTSEFPAGAEATRAGGQLTAKPGSSPSGSETSKSS